MCEDCHSLAACAPLPVPPRGWVFRGVPGGCIASNFRSRRQTTADAASRTPQPSAAMAEGKSGAGLFAKQVQKHFSRAQEKVGHGLTALDFHFSVGFLQVRVGQPRWATLTVHRSAPIGAHGLSGWVPHGACKASGLQAAPRSPPPKCFKKWDFLPRSTSGEGHGVGAAGMGFHGTVPTSPMVSRTRGREGPAVWVQPMAGSGGKGCGSGLKWGDWTWFGDISTPTMEGAAPAVPGWG